jgi:hypothetical protein
LGGYFFQSFPVNKIIQGFSRHCAEDAVKMKRGKTSYLSQLMQWKVLIKMIVDVEHYRADPAHIIFFDQGVFSHIVKNNDKI